MRIPNIKIKFDKLKAETDKALLIIINGKEQWIPKSLCSNIEIESGKKSLLLAPFKFEEITGIVPQAIDSFVIKEVANTTQQNYIEPPMLIMLKDFPLYEKQLYIVEKLNKMRYFFLYGEMRTGKTVVALTVAYSRLCAGIIDRIIVIAPLRTRTTWERHANECPILFIPTEHFSNENTRHYLDFSCNDKTMVILDESHQIKNQIAIRTSLIIEMTQNAGYRSILSGTPIGQHAGNIYTQFQFLNPSILGYKTYKSFEQMHLLYGGHTGKKVVAYTGIEEITAKISPYTAIMRRSDMGIDRVKIYELATFKMNNYNAYSKLREKYSNYYERNTSNAILGYLVKLQQAAIGYVFNEEDQVCGYEENGRRKCLDALLERFSDRQIVIYFKYNEDVSDMSDMDIPILNGKTPRKTFDKAIDDFNDKKINVIAIQQQMSIGFSLKAADVIIYYSRAFGSISSAQSEDRACERLDEPLIIVDIAASNTIDEQIKRTLDTQKDIVSLIKKHLCNE